MFERLEDDHGISICYENLGDTYMKMGEVRPLCSWPAQTAAASPAISHAMGVSESVRQGDGVVCIMRVEAATALA